MSWANDKFTPTMPAHLYGYPGFSASFSSRFPSLLSESNAHTSSLLRSCTHGLTCQHRGILALGLSLLCLNLLILRSRPRISYTMHTAELNATGSSAWTSLTPRLIIGTGERRAEVVYRRKAKLTWRSPLSALCWLPSSASWQCVFCIGQTKFNSSDLNT